MTTPIILVTGYLGAGKTTLLNHLLSLEEVAGQNCALIINEFGTLGVDGGLVRPGSWEMFEINKGSLFCICTKTDFLLALANIAQMPHIGVVIIEATGIAETSDIESFIDEEFLAGKFEVMADICIVDAANFTKVAAYLRAATSQVAWADGIVINKTDTVDPREVDTLRKVLAGINPDAPQTETSFGRIDYDFIASLSHTRPSDSMKENAPEKVCSVSIEADRDINRERFAQAVDTLGEKLLRLKGNVGFSDGPRLVQYVCGKINETEPMANRPKTAFAAITWDLPKEQVQAAFESAFV